MEEGQQSHGGTGKRKDMEFLSRPPLPKKGRANNSFNSKRKGGCQPAFDRISVGSREVVRPTLGL
jgi:hypothetical protein